MAAKSNVEIMQQESLDTGARGKVLIINITDAVSSGNAFHYIIAHLFSHSLRAGPEHNQIPSARLKAHLFKISVFESPATSSRSGGGFF
jgi:hypothetical protein